MLNLVSQVPRTPAWLRRWRVLFTVAAIALGPLVSAILLLALIWIWDHVALGRSPVWPLIYIIPAFIELIACLALPIEMPLRLILATACSIGSALIMPYIFFAFTCLLMGSCL